MNILVTGSTGLIGTALVARLTAEGNRVTRLVRPGGRSSEGGPASGRVADVAWDPAGGAVDVAALAEAGPYDGVVHLAGAGVGDRRWSTGRKEVILTSRTSSTALLVSTVLDLEPRPPVLVSASAIGFYGDRGDDELTEESTRGRGFLADVVEAWERAARGAADAGVRTVLLRTGLVLAPSGGVLAKQLPLFRAGVGGRLGSGRQYQSWITLDDEIGVILAALADGSLSGPLNAVAPAPVTNAQFTATLAHVLHRPAVLAVPAAALRLALGAEMADETALVSQRVLPAKLLAAGYAFAHPDLEGGLQAVLA